MASLSASGSVPMSRAIAGSEVAITVESMFSMNSATATISGTRRSRVIGAGWIRVRACGFPSGSHGQGQGRAVQDGPALWDAVGAGDDGRFFARVERGARAPSPRSCGERVGVRGAPQANDSRIGPLTPTLSP